MRATTTLRSWYSSLSKVLRVLRSSRDNWHADWHADGPAGLHARSSQAIMLHSSSPSLLLFSLLTLALQVRLVIWKCKDVVSMEFASGLNDLFVKAWLEGCDPQVTRGRGEREREGSGDRLGQESAIERSRTQERARQRPDAKYREGQGTHHVRVPPNTQHPACCRLAGGCDHVGYQTPPPPAPRHVFFFCVALFVRTPTPTGARKAERAPSTGG